MFSAMRAPFFLCCLFLPLLASAAGAETDPFWPGLDSPALKTPAWVGKPGVEAVVVLAIDDMRLDSVPKYEAFMRPLIDRLKKDRGRAPISVMTCTADPTEPLFQTWIKEGLNLDVHTVAHPCPLLGEKGFSFARETVFSCLERLSLIPNNRPVAYRMPCCDSLSSPSPRFYAEILPQATGSGLKFSIDSSVMNLITPADASLPRELVLDAQGKDRFAKYFPGIKSDGAHKQKSLRNFGTYIENYPYPYRLNDTAWELPCVVPSDWEAYNVLDKASPVMLEDWKAALDAVVLKQGVFTLVFHPHGWSTSQQLVDLVAYADSRHGGKVAFMNFADVAEQLARLPVEAGRKPVAKPDPAPLPELARHGGVGRVDLNADGHEDLVISNPQGYGVYIYNPVAKKNVQWEVGWTHVLREGKPGDANSLPLLVRADGTNNGVWFKHGAMWVQNEDTHALPDKVRRIPFSELLKVPGPAPKTAEESLRDLRLKPGYTARLVAHEPLVQDPVWVDWDARGRIWVVEMGDYPFAPGETTQDKRTGQGKVSALQSGRIKILEDADRDGVYEKATLFLDGLTHPTGLAFWKGGVFVASIPEVFYAEDTDGDGRCDRRETWFTGFTAGNPQHLVNGFCWGLDGWLYGANGDSGGEITCVKTGAKVKLGTNDFRFHPETGEFALETGRSQYGKWRDDHGNWFGNNNSVWGWHYWLPMAWLEAHPDIAVKNTRAVLNDDKRVIPASPPVRRFNWAGAIETLTSGCNPIPWHDGKQDVLLVCEPANNLVHREVLDYAGGVVKSARHPEDATSEFIASADNWFRPTMARQGPDGALYVVDMYRLVLEHPEWIPAEIAQNIDLRAGEQMGRIYRVAASAVEGRQPFSPDHLTQELRSPIRWRRDTAQRLLLEGRREDLAPALKALADDASAASASRVQALFTLKILGTLTAEDIVARLRPLDSRIRAGALVAAGARDDAALSQAEWKALQEQAAGSKSGKALPVPVITRSNADRHQVVVRYSAEVARLKGDASRGPQIFQAACMACHRSQNLGVEVGPDLATVAAKPAEQLIEAIFDPNRAVELRNAATQVTTHAGAIFAGLLVTETPANLTLRLPGGVEQVVKRAEIRETRTLPASLMPEGMESVLTPQDTADLLAWLKAGTAR